MATEKNSSMNGSPKKSLVVRSDGSSPASAAARTSATVAYGSSRLICAHVGGMRPTLRSRQPSISAVGRNQPVDDASDVSPSAICPSGCAARKK